MSLSSVVDSSHLTVAGQTYARARSFSFVAEAVCEYGLQRHSFVSAPAAVLELFTRHAAHCFTDSLVPSTFAACLDADLLVPPPPPSASAAAAASSAAGAAFGRALQDARRALFDMCLRLNLSVCIAHLVSETVQDKNSDTPQLLLPYVWRALLPVCRLSGLHVCALCGGVVVWCCGVQQS